MRFNLATGKVMLLVVCATVALALVGVTKDIAAADAPAPTLTPGANQQQQRTKFSLPRLFDFSNFKRLFNKQYSSPIEELAREKMFLARAYRSFISAVKYRWNMATKWLAINHFSDRSPESLKKLDAHKGQLWSFRRDAPVDKSENEVPPSGQQVPAASREDIERELAEAQRHKDEPGYREIVDQLSPRLRRRKRDTLTLPRRQLSLEDLVHAPVAKITESQARVPSNNPDYEPPELESQSAVGAGDEGRPQEEPLGPEEASFISKLPGASFISSLTGEITRRLAGPKGLKGERAKELIGLTQAEVEKQVETVGKLKQGDELLIDHRKSGCFFRVRDQGDCGSCYIFSTIALYEWMHCRDTGNLVAFSEQYPLDCGHRLNLKGCVGGEERDVGDFVRYYGLELRTNYPYNQRVNTCPYEQSADPKVMGYLKAHDEFGLHTIGFRKLEEVLKERPILLGFGQYDGFFEYGGGVDKPDGECDENRGHAMLLVGMGVQDGQEYWLFRNSYDVDWGENGYYKLSKDSNCLMGMYGWTSKATFKWKGAITTNPHYIGDSVLANRNP